jgi:hypothetical protein
MDERFRGKGLWMGLGVLAIVFLCVMLCGAGALGTMFMSRSGPVYGVVPQVQPPTGDEGAVPPAYYGPGYGVPHVGFSPFGFLFKLAFAGLFLLLLLGLIKRIFWGPRHWHRHHWGGPPRGKAWGDKPHPGWGPWAWHGCGQEEESEAQPRGEEGESGSGEFAYSGPQE